VVHGRAGIFERCARRERYDGAQAIATGDASIVERSADGVEVIMTGAAFKAGRTRMTGL